MKILRTVVAGLLIAAFGTIAFAADKVKLRQGAPALGTLTQMSPDEVTIEQGPVKKKFPITEFSFVEYDEEPNTLTTLIRSAYEDGRYPEVLTALGKIDATEIKRPEILQDLAFYKAASLGRLALGGAASPGDAGKLLVAFERKDSASYHYLEVCELLGDLLVASGRFENAQTYYDKIGSSSLPEYKLKSGVLSGRALEAQKQYDKAIAKFDEVIISDAQGKEAQSQKLSAMIGKGACLAATDKVPDGIKMIEEAISKADASDLQLHARGYNALGKVYAASGKKKEALIAYLHTDLLFSGFPEQHAEALAALSTLWLEADKAGRAKEAKDLLDQKYKNSRWAQGK
jgi:tetratricopeptide (TPR) repeat protein